MIKRILLTCAATALALGGASAHNGDRDHSTPTPIKHLVVIFQENISFDHYFGTYPHAENNPNETPFTAKKNTPKRINNLIGPLDVTNGFKPLQNIDLINANPNGPSGSAAAKKLNGADARNPFRLSPLQALTADQGHNYTPEQQASDNGLMDLFPAFTGADGSPPSTIPGLVMGYYDGNTVTALWNYAQHFALNDNSWTTTFGPSTPGAISLISGQTNGFDAKINVLDPATGALLHPTHEVADGAGNFTEIGDGDPLLDVCSAVGLDQITMHGRNIGDMLNEKNITWGWFEGGFDLTVVNANGTTGCARATDPTAEPKPAGFTRSTDYIPHHEPFQYYASTRNPTHARPGSVAAIGHTTAPGSKTPDPANHQYDINDWFKALGTGNLPAVSFLKAAAFEDGHAGYSDPLDEQHFLVRVLNALQEREEWEETAVIIMYDDSDGWYDHQAPPIVNPSTGPADALNAPGVCNHGLQQGGPTPATPLNGSFGKPVGGRCGYGTRLPLLVVSPFAKKNVVDHTLTDQTSIIRFIEDNWLSGERVQPGGSFDTIAGTLDNMFNFERHEDDERHEHHDRKLILDEQTGEVVSASH